MALHSTKFCFPFRAIQTARTTTRLWVWRSCLLVAALAALSSCLRVPPDNTVSDCPVPVQQCQPNTWKGNDFAGIPSYGRPGMEHRVDIVASVNSPDNELALAFGNAGVAFLTTGNQGTAQTLRSAAVASALDVRTNNALQVADMATFGTPTLYNGQIIAAGVASTAYTGDADLYTCTLQPTSVGAVRRMDAPISLPLVWDAHPALSPDGTVLFFASDRPGGYGGTDIWYSVQRAGTWSQPYNCGAMVNTACDEITPFVTPDGKHLLFSSAGHETVGGYDIFSTDLSSEFYTTAKQGKPAEQTLQLASNLGTPINSADDELFPSTPAQFDTLLYFSSNRPMPASIPQEQGGGFDIYVLHVVPPSLASTNQRTAKRNETSATSSRTTTTSTAKTQTDKTPTENTQPNPNDTLAERYVLARGRVLQHSTHTPVSEASVTVRDEPTRDILDRTRTDSAGRYTVRIPVERDVEITAQGKHLFYDTKHVRAQKDDTASIIIPDFALPGDLALRLNFPNDEYNNPYPYLLDSNGQATTQRWSDALDLLAQNLQIYGESIQQLILTGHTDDVADNAYNKALGMRRAQFVVNELIQRGVPASKLEARSEGEQRLLARRAGEDIDTYRIRCRRVELTKKMIFILPNGK